MVYLNAQSEICKEGAYHWAEVDRTIQTIKRDMESVFIPNDTPGSAIVLRYEKQERECFCLENKADTLEIRAGDPLGFIYGLYEVSRTFLGILPFWFWNDQVPDKKEGVVIPEGYRYQSQPFRVKFRGWFVNDEVLIHTWNIAGDKDLPWEMVFEALLRLGGNTVIPGTDRNARRYRSLASAMGLWITHHHAEPLGVEMFARAYPDLTASYEEHGEKFHQLWREGIQDQEGLRVIWNLGFRGQGDCPFWVNDPKYQTDEARGGLISELIRIQAGLLKESVSDAICSTNLYGETMELYQKGCLDLPRDVMRIWADNGYGKMVTRRQDNHNPRVRALPQPGDKGENGIYYHVSFYDLQAANHITMMPNSPTFIKKELEQVLDLGMDAIWIINCSNVKPHMYPLDAVAQIWKDGSLDVQSHVLEYARQYYGEEGAEDVAHCLEDFFSCAPKFGSHEDEHAGEQFANHMVRMLIHAFMQDREAPAKDCLWAAKEKTLTDQVSWYQGICEEAVSRYGDYLTLCLETQQKLKGSAVLRFQDTILLQAKILYHCYQGAAYACQSMQLGIKEDWKKAFFYAGQAREQYRLGNQAMKDCERGSWKDFYQNECLTDVKQTAWVLTGMMSYLRSRGDGPHYYEWQREYLYSPEDRKVMLILNMENHLTDDEIYERMKQTFLEL
jgi:hypothetical protein